MSEKGSKYLRSFSEENVNKKLLSNASKIEDDQEN